jgi:hypothetical protein
MTSNTRGKVQQFAKNNFEAALHTLKDEYQAKRKTVGASLAARRLGLEISPSHSIYDNVEVWHCEAILRAEANALFKAYEVYDLTPDASILEELRSRQQQHSASRKRSLMNEAILRGQRMRINPAADLAHAQELAQKIESSTRALLKVFACELEERRYMPRAEKTRTVTYSQNVYGNPTNVAQGESATITYAPVNDVYTSIQASIESSVPNEQERDALLQTLRSLQQAKDKPTFLERSKHFLGLVTTCTQLAPHLAHWSQVLAELAHRHGF